ncbi:MAG: M42 family metallopeptidase [Anaerolineae bacterium]|nr:M42 family metallopeptidase [Anaerolineae bacterium]
MFDLKAHLKTLVETHAPSGHEGPIRQVVRDAWAGYVTEMEQDKLGSLIGIKRATHPTQPPRRIMLAAHMDEIGMMVREVVDGFLYVHNISGVDNRLLLAQPVMVQGKRPLPGIVATMPPHLLPANGRDRYPGFDDLVVDVGLPAAEVAELVQPGDLITPDVTLLELNGKRVAAKAMDDRACVAAVTACLDYLQGMNHAWDVYAAATVQEETGLYGAKTAAYHIQPDIAIALDVTFAPQPGVNGDESYEMGAGPVLAFGPNFYPKLVEKIKDTAGKHEIKIQHEIIAGASGTDAWAIQVAREGIPTALLGVPLRNMHSPVETVDLRDIDRAGRLLAHFIASLDADFLSAIEWSAE